MNSEGTLGAEPLSGRPHFSHSFEKRGRSNLTEELFVSYFFGCADGGRIPFMRRYIAAAA
jgi:hypothetical protein